MLSRLIINNVALIDKLDIDLDGGFNVLTGETGAGKSIIIDSVNLVLGERGSKELIAGGKQKARVEAFFDLSNLSAAGDKGKLFERLDQMGIEHEDDELIIVREITSAGKSLCRVNGEIVNLSALKSITETLVDVHGQHEHQSLLDPKKHIGMLDSFREEKTEPALQKVNALYEEYRAITKKLSAGFVSEAERERRVDILSYQINEINAASLSREEETAIEDEIKLLSNAERIDTALEKGSSQLSSDGGALDKLRCCVDALADISELSEQYAELYERLNGAFYEAEDAAYQLRELRYSFEYSPERLNELERRLDLINALKRKYGGSVEAVLEFRDNAQLELEELTGADELRKKLTEERNKIENEYKKASSELSNIRKLAAEELKDGVMRELGELGMKKAVFDVRFTSHDEIRHGGVDEVEFMLSANEGGSLRPLSKVASGGELSRIMLAIKTVCAASDGISTLIFDEVDTGISGHTATKVGERLSLVSRSKQVLSVTHLPQIAAFADSHLFVEKHAENGETHTSLKKLSEDERKKELARIMGAEESAASAVSYASEMIEKADGFKKSMASF